MSAPWCVLSPRHFGCGIESAVPYHTLTGDPPHECAFVCAVFSALSRQCLVIRFPYDKTPLTGPANVATDACGPPGRDCGPCYADSARRMPPSRPHWQALGAKTSAS